MFNNWYASNGYVLLHIFFDTHCTSFFYSLSSSMLMFLQFICNSICKHTTKNWIGVKGNNEGQPKIAHILKLVLGADEFGQSSIFFGLILISNLFTNTNSIVFPLFFFSWMKNVWVDLNMKKQLKPRKSLGFIISSCWTLLGAAIFNI